MPRRACTLMATRSRMAADKAVAIREQLPEAYREGLVRSPAEAPHQVLPGAAHARLADAPTRRRADSRTAVRRLPERHAFQRITLSIADRQARPDLWRNGQGGRVRTGPDPGEYFSWSCAHRCGVYVWS